MAEIPSSLTQPNGTHPPAWSTYMRECYASRNPPPLGSVSVDEIEQAAREKLKEYPSI